MENLLKRPQAVVAAIAGTACLLAFGHAFGADAALQSAPSTPSAAGVNNVTVKSTDISVRKSIPPVLPPAKTGNRVRIHAKTGQWRSTPRSGRRIIIARHRRDKHAS